MDSVYYQQYVQPLLDSNGPELIIFNPGVPWQKQALDAIESAWQHCVREDDGFPFLVRNQLSRLIYLLHSHLSPISSSVSSKDLRDAQRIKTMLSRIHANFSSELTTAEIAKCVSISESECLRCFRSTIGTTPIQYLKQYRIQQAARLLSETRLKISDIAVLCGFQDMSYFTRAFRAQMGCVPSEYRKGL